MNVGGFWGSVRLTRNKISDGNQLLPPLSAKSVPKQKYLYFPTI